MTRGGPDILVDNLKRPSIASLPLEGP